MGIRPNKPASVASATEIRRAASMSQEELAQSAPFASIDPASIPEMKVWLRVDQATDSGTLTIPDAMGGSPAVQATAARKPALGTTGNGLAKLTNAVDDFLQLPLSSGLNDANYFGMGMWLRPSSIVTGGDILSITRVGAAGLASADKLNWRQDANDVVNFIWLPGADGTRRGKTNGGLLQLNVWKFICLEFDGAQATELAQHRYKDMGTALTAQQLPTFSPGVAPGTTPPTTLISATGSAILFNRTTAAAAGFIGDIGPDIFFYDPRTISVQNLVNLANFRVPLG
jgi:hypothetical protein